MTLQLKTLSFYANDGLRLAHFWAEALNWEAQDGADKLTLAPTDGTRFNLNFLQKPREKHTKNRIHIDISTTSDDDQTKLVAKLIELGAHPVDVGQPSDAPHVVLADPEGNEFCVVEPDNSFVNSHSRLGSITCDGSRAVGHFWSKAFGWPLVWNQDEETAIRHPSGTGPFITWGSPVPPKTIRNRLRLELAPSPDTDRQTEIDRLVSLGAKIDTASDRDGKTVMVDPDGNEFVLLR